jgi:hypothetical protein
MDAHSFREDSCTFQLSLFKIAHQQDYRSWLCDSTLLATPLALVQVELLLEVDLSKKSMTEVLHREHAFSDMFVAYLPTRNIRYEEDLLDQLLNSSEKRLARILLLLAHFSKEGKPESLIPKMSQETLAEMVGTDIGANPYRHPHLSASTIVRYFRLIPVQSPNWFMKLKIFSTT